MNTSSRTAGLVGARIGVLAGFTSWIVLLGIICACTGRTQYLWPVVVPVLLASLGMGLVVLQAIEPAMPGAPPAGQFGLRVAGGVCIAIGLLLLLADALVVPMLASERDLAAVVDNTGGVLALPREVSTALLAIGCVLAARALRAAAPPSAP